MTGAIRKGSDGKYRVGNHTFEKLVGSRAEVWHHTAYKTAGGLTHAKLMQNKHGRIVSKSKHASAKKEKRLEKAGYKTKKGQFGSFLNTKNTKKTKKTRKSRKSRK